jgi:hypothetical protein
MVLLSLRGKALNTQWRMTARTGLSDSRVACAKKPFDDGMFQV